MEDEKNLCPACEKNIPKKTVIVIGVRCGDSLRLLQKAMEEAQKSMENLKDVLLVLDNETTSSSILDLVTSRKFDGCLNPQEEFLKKKEKYNKRRFYGNTRRR